MQTEFGAWNLNGDPVEGQRVFLAVISCPSNAPVSMHTGEAIFRKGKFLASNGDERMWQPYAWMPMPDPPPMPSWVAEHDEKVRIQEAARIDAKISKLQEERKAICSAS